MERSGKRGKIPQQDWPSIIARYEAGETLASIARTYDCSPPAISYILSRSRARTAAASPAAPLLENEGAAPPQAAPQGGSPAAAPDPAASSAGRAEGASGQGNGFTRPDRDHVAAGADPSAPRPAAPSAILSGNGAHNGSPAGPVRGLEAERGPQPPPREAGARGPQDESRRTLRLPQGPASGPERNGDAQPGFGARPPAPRSAPAESPHPQPARRPSGSYPGPYAGPYGQGNSASPRALAEPHHNQKEGGAIDQALRERVHAALTAFLAAFDTFLADDTSGSRTGLREATDHLLRAGARTRIELERLEARLPLPARETGAGMPAWRQR